MIETVDDLIDFTSLWTIMKSDKPSPSYWFYMHDTMEVGPHFRSLLLTKVSLLLQARGKDALGAIALTSQSGKSMNLGLYSHNMLLAQADLFKKEVVDVLMQMDVYTRKERGGELEDCLFPQPLSLVLCLVQDVEVSG